MYKATAVAHPMQGLIKYHGLRDEGLRLPFHDSISVSTSPLKTRTTIAFDDYSEDTATIDGKAVSGRAMERILAVVNEVRRIAGTSSKFRMESVNNFTSGTGLGASSSGFAALALASSHALSLKLEQRKVSSIARLGAGSASRAVSGGFSRWYMGWDHDSSYAQRIDDGQVDLAIVIAPVETVKQTEDAHREVLHSPVFQARLSYIHRALSEMEGAIRSGNTERIGVLAEMDTLMLHAVTMTGPSRMIFWKPDTLKVIEEVKLMRKEGISCFYSIDTGSSVYVNCRKADVAEVNERISALGIGTSVCGVGGGVSLSGEHLF